MTAPLLPQAEKHERHWAQVNEIGFVAGMRFLFWIYRIFGRWPFRIVLYPIVAWYMLTKRAAREASRGYLRRVNTCGNGPKAAPSMMAIMRHFSAFAECMLDKMLLWGGLYKFDNTVLNIAAEFFEDFAQRRGGLIISSHFGNLELCRILSKQRAGFKISVMVHSKNARTFNKILEQLDPQSQVDLLEVSEITPATAMMLTEKIGRGEYVVIAGDRIPVAPNPRVTSAKLLGDDAAFPVGPYILASLLKCPVYLLFSMRIGDRSEVHFERFSESVQLPRKGRDEMLAGLAAQYAVRLEYFCMRAPLQWFNFFDFWCLPRMELPDASR